jgi:hypothetical protein
MEGQTHKMIYAMRRLNVSKTYWICLCILKPDHI